MPQPISFQSSGLRIAGFLDRPKNHPIAAVVLVHGSGPETADSGNGYEGRNVEKSPVQIFRSLGKDLSQKGILVLRYDKRGVRKSQGDWVSITRTNLLEDLCSAVRYLHKNFSDLPIFLVGFSEGANLAISTAIRMSRIAGIVLAGGAAEKLPKVVLAKTKKKLKLAGFSKNQIDSELKRHQKIFQLIRMLPRNKKIRKLWGVNPIRWWQERLTMTPPKAEVKKLRCPVLILHGKDDLEVLVEEAYKMKKVLKKKKIPHQMKVFPGLNHFFARSNLKNPGSEYAKPFRISPKVPTMITRWVKATI